MDTHVIKTKLCVDTIIIAPYFEDSATTDFCQELAENLNANDYLIIIDDGSVAQPFNVELLKKLNLKGQVIKLSQNIGHQAAISCGLAVALEDFSFKTVVVIDSDGEDRPSDIQRLVQNLHDNNELEVVVATRRSRFETTFFKICYRLYQIMFRLAVGRSIRFGNYMALTPFAVQRLVVMKEASMHLAASVIKSGLSLKPLSLHRGARYSGDSQMNLRSLTLHGLKSLLVFFKTVMTRLTLFFIFLSIVFLLIKFVPFFNDLMPLRLLEMSNMFMVIMMLLTLAAMFLLFVFKRQTTPKKSNLKDVKLLIEDISYVA